MPEQSQFRWLCPAGGPAPTPQALAIWAQQHLPDSIILILCAARDLAALAASLQGRMVEMPSPGRGVVQAGTVWVA